MNTNKGFWHWLAGSLEGHDGRASSKKMSIFAFTFFFGLMVICTLIVKIWRPETVEVFPDTAWYTCSFGAIGLSGSQAYQAVRDYKTSKIS
jgi:hypothetical protein